MDVDTIVALATPRGVGALGVVRLSGPDAARILRAVSGRDALPEPRRATLTTIIDPADGRVIDRALVTLFDAPASYTGEDVVEISCHGGFLTPSMVVDACVHAGARRAERGEFTKRAYLRGKVDLVQAEATADLIEARSRAFHDAVLGQLERGLSRRVSELRDQVVRIETLLAHHVDFPEEDDAPVSLAAVCAEADALAAQLDRMLATAPEGALLREGAVAVLAGRPNVGKSSLYNALIGEERAIVTRQAGTTRDALETTVQLGGFPFRLVDTAGLRDSEDEIERLGIEVAQRYLERADVILLCIEAASGMSDVDRRFLSERRAPVVLVRTKADLVGGSPPAPEGESAPPDVAGRVLVSIETGLGLDELKTLLPRLVYSAVVEARGESPVLTRRRQVRAMESARAEIEAFGAGLRDGLPAEVAASHLRSAETSLEELLGVVSVDDVLDAVFREFCIGK
ncbi:MAG: tRNA uridine-5-carboxymethylaminomethyl(34) synthesis GTPase MnmE [Gemmatimonadota bacterium]|nr:tRNA uridine-5-carboxymethylaminomethyl(34) synthesis GTPase MnmE [Gemmatimonadota bacterium]